MKLCSFLYCVALFAVTGCVDSEKVTLFDGSATHSKTERGDIIVDIALRPKKEPEQALQSLDALLARAKLELPLYTASSDGWELAGVRSFRSDRREVAYLFEFRKGWDEWITVVLAPDGTVLGRPKAL